MIWYAWRTQRLQLVLAVVAIGGFAMLIVTSGIHEQSQRLWVELRCGVAYPLTQACDGVQPSNFTHWNNYFEAILYAAPGVLGVLLGAPVVAKELEAGTARLAWTQGVTRTRWLARKLAVPALLVGGLAGVLAVAANWWAGSVGMHIDKRLQPAFFDVTGIVIVGYATFAFALAVAFGALFRRASLAIAGGFVVFAAIRWVFRTMIRPHVAPVATASIKSELVSSWPSAVAHGWLLHQGFVPVGQTGPAPGRTWQTGTLAVQACQRVVQHTMNQCAARLRLHFVVQFQPVSHYWWLQVCETLAFVALAAVCLGTVIAVVRRV